MTVITIGKNSDGNYYAMKDVDGSTYTTTDYAITKQYIEYWNTEYYYTETEAYVIDIKHKFNAESFLDYEGTPTVITNYYYNNGKYLYVYFSVFDDSINIIAQIYNASYIKQEDFTATKITKLIDGTSTVYSFYNDSNNVIGTVTYSPETNSFTAAYTAQGTETTDYQNLALVASAAVGHNFVNNGTGDSAVIQSMYAMIDSVINYV
jgi:hypothetical protein